jgi:hypothetical protein
MVAGTYFITKSGIKALSHRLLRNYIKYKGFAATGCNDAPLSGQPCAHGSNFQPLGDRLRLHDQELLIDETARCNHLRRGRVLLE